MICTSCKKESTHNKNDLCLDCYFKLYSPTNTKNTSWLFQQAPPRFDLPAISKDPHIDQNLTKLVVKGQYHIHKDKNQLQIGNYSFPYTPDGMDELAKKTNLRIGKWLIYRSEESIDNVWKRLAILVMKRKLGTSAKVSTAQSKGKSYVICVYTKDFLDEVDVWRVREELLSEGYDESLCYKPDLYTYLNIYSGTSMIKPCRYRK